MPVSYKVSLEPIMYGTNEYNSVYIDFYTRIQKGTMGQKVQKLLYKCETRDIHVSMLTGSEMM